MLLERLWKGAALGYAAVTLALVVVVAGGYGAESAPTPADTPVAVAEPADGKVSESTIPPIPPVPPAANGARGGEPSRTTPPAAARPLAPGPSRRTSPSPSLDQYAMRTRGTPSLRLASVPNMLGDFGVSFQKANLDPLGADSVVDLPLAGGGPRGKISENNKALPMDRVYFQYNHFHNASTADLDAATVGDEISGHTDRYTIGLEKTFFDQLWSVDVRMPFATTEDVVATDLSVSGGAVGNLDVIFKRLLAVDDQGALAAGIGINTPTGSDVEVNSWRNYSVENEAVHLSPFVGALYQPSDRLFFHGFLEVDVPLNGNTLIYDLGTATVELGAITEQTLMKADFSTGYWLYRNPHACVTGLASIVEFHYTGTLNDGDVIPISDRFGGLLNRIDLMNLTVGMHAELNRCTTLRVGGVLPLNDVDRAFDAEVLVSLNRYF